MKPIAFQNVPECLVNECQWVLWKEVVRNGKATKMPVSVYHDAASSTDPATWSSFECAVMRFDESIHSGIGWVFRRGGGFAGIDLDGCRDPQTGVIQDWAWKWIDKFRGYTEISPSETGVKIWIRCNKELAKGVNEKVNQPAVSSKTPGVEVYTQGRYFAVTGHVIRGYESL